EEQAVWMPADNREGIGENWNLFETDPEKQLTGFVAAILQSMQNWNDNTQLVIPGYRDRIVHVALKDDEGGMNLDMPEEVIRRVSDRGTGAADQLISRFADGGHKMGWDNHRWVRLRSSLAVIEKALAGVADAYHDPGADPTYEQLITRGPNDPPGSYCWAEGQQAVGLRVI